MKSYRAHFSVFSVAFATLRQCGHDFGALSEIFHDLRVIRRISVVFRCFSVVARVIVLKSYKAHFSVFQYLRGSRFEGVFSHTFFSVFQYFSLRGSWFLRVTRRISLFFIICAGHDFARYQAHFRCFQWLRGL